MVSNPHYDYGLLRRAIVASLLLHVVLLLQPGLGALSSPSAAAPALRAWLRPSVKSPPPGPALPLPATHAEPAPPAAHEVSAVAAAVVAAAPPQIAAVAAAESPGSPNASNHGNGAAVGAAAATGDVESDFSEMRKEYLFAIAAEARRVKKYPARALTAGWAGTAEIHVSVAAGGNVQPPQLGKSSGYADIDNAALLFVGIALKRTPLPESLRGRNFDFVLPVSFTLRDE